MLLRKTSQGQETSTMKNIGLSFFSKIVRKLNYKNANALIEPLKRISSCIGTLGTGDMFKEWSPSLAKDPTELTLDPVRLFCSDALRNVENSIESDDTTVGLKMSTEENECWWAATFAKKTAVHAISCSFGDKVPKKVIFSMSNSTDVDDADFKELETAEVDDSAAKVEFVVPAQCRCIKLTFKDEKDDDEDDAESEEKLIDLKKVLIHKLEVQTDPMTQLDDLQYWARNCLKFATDEARIEAVKAMKSLVLAGGVLEHALDFAEFLRSIHDLKKEGELKSILDEFFETLKDHIQEKRLQNSKVTLSTGSTNVDPVFDDVSSGISIEDGGKAVRSDNGSNSYACLNIGISSGKASWEWELTQDTTSQCSCFGLAIKPVSSSSYESSSQLWMYRAYNGNHYSAGSRTGSSSRIATGAMVRCDLDMDAGTMNLFINGTDQGVVFSNLQEHAVIYPAVAFYSSQRKITLNWFQLASSSGPSETPVKLQDVPTVDTKLPEEANLGYFKSSEEHKNINTGAGMQLANSRICMLPPKPEVVEEESKEEEIVEESKESEKMHYSSIKYDLEGKYTRFESVVCMSTSITNDKLEETNSTYQFQVLVDGVMLWESKVFSRNSDEDTAKVPTVKAKQLELRTVCLSGDESLGHLVWGNPFVIEAQLWYCPNCGFRNAALEFSCVKCESSRDAIADLPTADESAVTGAELSDLFLDYLACLASSYQRALKHVNKAEADQKVTTVDLENPFAIHACAPLLNRLCSMIEDCLKTCDNVDEKWLASLLTLLEVNVETWKASQVSPKEVGIIMEKREDCPPIYLAEGTSEQVFFMDRLKELAELIEKSTFTSERKDIIREQAAALVHVQPTSTELTQALKNSNVIEFHAEWPLNGDERNLPSDATLLHLILDLKKEYPKINIRLLGDFPRYVFVVIDASDPSITLGSSFLSMIAKVMTDTSLEKEWTIDSETNFMVKLETSPMWSRMRRLPFERGDSWMRVYSKECSFNEVITSIEEFLKLPVDDL
eukprot:TRINITY_DN232160_c0_g1_i1.p1 TRINITY_DN232160_c0_g1~~TRINITY_DN232160_c0_g1_i1.p1  ORF type:complete len:1011 (-),score=336.00 TRINITY_DN232160_c0_g1_i1:236-3268(-)